jgi:hypothetical protein
MMIDHDFLAVISVDIHGSEVFGMANKNALETERSLGRKNIGVAHGARTHDNRNHNPDHFPAFTRLPEEFF